MAWRDGWLCWSPFHVLWCSMHRFSISRVVHNNWLYLNRVNIFYSIFILMRFKSLFKNFPNCGWFWIKTDLHFWAKKTCIVVSRSVGTSTLYEKIFWKPLFSLSLSLSLLPFFLFSVCFVLLLRRQPGVRCPFGSVRSPSSKSKPYTGFTKP